MQNTNATNTGGIKKKYQKKNNNKYQKKKKKLKIHLLCLKYNEYEHEYECNKY